MRIKKGRVLPKVLSTLVNITAASLASGGGSAYQLFRKFDQLQELSDRQLRNVTRYAIDSRYIVITKREGRSFIELTKEGERIVGREAVGNLRPKKPKVWDKKWRLVLFDIPETHKSGRDGFAANLKRLGFVQIQKSVFAYPYPCFEELEVLADFHKVTPFITCVLAESVSNAARIRRHFAL